MIEFEEYWDYEENSDKIQQNLDTIWGCAYGDTDEDEIQKIQNDPELIQVLCREVVQCTQENDRLRDRQEKTNQKLSDHIAGLSDLLALDD